MRTLARLNIFYKHKTMRVLVSALLAGFALLFACNNNSDKPQNKPGENQDPELAALDALLAKDPKNDSLLYLRAGVYYKLEGYDEALSDLEKALAIDSNHVAYYHLMADVMLDYARPNDSKRAIEVLEAASAKFPTSIHTLLKLSEFNLIVRRHNQALAAVDKVFRQNPQHPEGYFMTGRIALDMGDTTRAIKSLQRAVQLDATNIDAWMFLGKIMTNRNDPVAIQYFDNVLRLDSTDLEAREYKGILYKRRGEFEKAFQVYRDIIVRNPDYANAYFDMGLIYLEQDSLQKAFDNFNIAVQVDQLFVKAYFYRGLSAELQGNLDAAKLDYEQANKMSPAWNEPKEALERLNK